jgi:hypothetical protein
MSGFLNLNEWGIKPYMILGRVLIVGWGGGLNYLLPLLIFCERLPTPTPLKERKRPETEYKFSTKKTSPMVSNLQLK